MRARLVQKAAMPAIIVMVMMGWIPEAKRVQMFGSRQEITASSLRRSVESGGGTADEVHLETDAVINLRPNVSDRSETRSLPGSDFLRSHIDLNATAVCGSRRCTYRSKTNTSMGYILSAPSDGVKRTFDFALSLEQKYGIHHTFSLPPEIYLFSQEDGEKLSRNQYWSNKNNSNSCPFPCHPREAFAASVQPVHFMEESDSILLDGHDEDPLYTKLMGFIRKKMKENPVNDEDAKLTFHRHIQASQRALEETPCLRHGFRFFVGIDGTITHANLERCFNDDGIDDKEVDPSRLTEVLEYCFRTEMTEAEVEFGNLVMRAVVDDEAKDEPSLVLNGTELMQQLDTSGRLICGWNKCVLRNRTDPSLGIVAGVQHRFPTSSTFISRMRLSGEDLAMSMYNFTIDLEKKFGIQHTLAAPPRRYRFKPQDVSRLDTRRSKPSCGRFPYCFNHEFTAHIQPIRFYDKTTTALVKTGVEEVRKLFRENATKLDKESVLATLRDHIQRTRDMLEAEPCLWNDLQYLVNLDGTITQIDLDRCVSTEECPSRVEMFDNLFDIVSQAIDGASN